MKDKIKKARKTTGLNQTQMAKKLGMFQQGYCEVETGNRNFTMKQLKEFCKVTNVSADYLLGLTSQALSEAVSDCKDKQVKDNEEKRNAPAGEGNAPAGGD